MEKISVRILVTGLCLQGNKGGPALALSLKSQILKHIPEANFVFSVPRNKEYRHEEKWAEEYNVDIVEDFSYLDLVFPINLIHSAYRFSRFKVWLNELKKCDLVIELSAISYVGPPTGSLKKLIFGPRFRYFLFANRHHKQFLAWTQSYGPLTSWIARMFAKWDLKRQPIIFCRGEETLENIQKLLPEKPALSYPDVAIILSYDKEWGKKYIQSHFNLKDDSRIVTISPSAVMYQRSSGKLKSNEHIKDLIKVSKFLVAQDCAVVFVPHTFRPDQSVPEVCDTAVSKIIVESLDNINQVYLLDEDLSPHKLKSIISNAFIHIGARYHSIVAALSLGVPCISFSWHHKYRDIMRMYDLENFVVGEDVKAQGKQDNFEGLFNQLVLQQDKVHRNLIERQNNLRPLIDQNTKEFIAQIRKDE